MEERRLLESLQKLDTQILRHGLQAAGLIQGQGQAGGGGQRQGHAAGGGGQGRGHGRQAGRGGGPVNLTNSMHQVGGWGHLWVYSTRWGEAPVLWAYRTRWAGAYCA